MILFKKAKALSEHLQKLQNQKLLIGLVPTMGALHNGHIALVKQAAKECDIVVCSIFVNPVQFNNKNDFEKYPVTIENDILLLETNNTDFLFLPSVHEMYVEGTDNLKQFHLGYLENILEGHFRPNHFQGVCNVVYNLLNIIKPNIAYFGQKDYQQIMVVKKMMKAYYPDIQLHVSETIREDDGLAMSSRNLRLNNEARKKASAVYEALQFIKQNIEVKNFDELKMKATEIILKNGFEKIDYIEICDAETLQPLSSSDHHKKLITLAAAYINDIRLIDNLFL